MSTVRKPISSTSLVYEKTKLRVLRFLDVKECTMVTNCVLVGRPGDLCYKITKSDPLKIRRKNGSTKV